MSWVVIAGTVSAAGAVACAVLALRRLSAVERRLRALTPIARARAPWRPVSDRDLVQSGVGCGQGMLAAAKLGGLLVGAVGGSLAGQVIGAGSVAGLAFAYGGFVIPSLGVERRAAARRRDAELRLGAVFERVEALAAAGRPVETALAAVSETDSGSALLDATLRRAAGAYALGAPLFRSLAARARDEGLDQLAIFGAELERSRDLGQGSLTVVRDAREAARARRRSRSLEAAAQVEGKLMLTLVLCYLPALFLLVVIPLFLTLLDGLFG